MPASGIMILSKKARKNFEKSRLFLIKRAYEAVLRSYRFRRRALNKSMPSSIQVSFAMSTSIVVLLSLSGSFSNVPSSSFLYHIMNPVRSQNSILHLSPIRLKNTNRCPLKGSFCMKLSASIESLLKPQRISVG